MKKIAAVALCSAIIIAPVTHAQETGLDDALPPVVQKLVDCRQLTDPAERLACYDTQTAELVAARERDEIVLADKEQISEAKRGLFGFSLPKLRIFFGNDENEISEIEGVIAAIASDGGSRSLFILEDGARWLQIDGRHIRAKPGATITIRKAALGSYMGKIGNFPSIRVKRLAD